MQSHERGSSASPSRLFSIVRDLPNCKFVCLSVITSTPVSLSFCSIVPVAFHCTVQYMYRFTRGLLKSIKHTAGLAYPRVGWLITGGSRLKNYQETNSDGM